MSVCVFLFFLRVFLQYYLLTLLFIANWSYCYSNIESIVSVGKKYEKGQRQQQQKKTWTINQFIIIVNLSGGCDIDTLHCFQWTQRMKNTKKQNEIVISDREFATGFLCYVVVIVVQCVGCMYGVETVKWKLASRIRRDRRVVLRFFCLFVCSSQEKRCYVIFIRVFISFGYLILFFAVMPSLGVNWKIGKWKKHR